MLMFTYELVFMNEKEDVQAFAGKTKSCTPNEIIEAHCKFVEPGYTLRSFIYQPLKNKENGSQKIS